MIFKERKKLSYNPRQTTSVFIMSCFSSTRMLKTITTPPKSLSSQEDYTIWYIAKQNSDQKAQNKYKS